MKVVDLMLEGAAPAKVETEGRVLYQKDGRLILGFEDTPETVCSLTYDARRARRKKVGQVMLGTAGGKEIYCDLSNIEKDWAFIADGQEVDTPGRRGPARNLRFSACRAQRAGSCLPPCMTRGHSGSGDQRNGSGTALCRTGIRHQPDSGHGLAQTRRTPAKAGTSSVKPGRQKRKQNELGRSVGCFSCKKMRLW